MNDEQRDLLARARVTAELRIRRTPAFESEQRYRPMPGSSWDSTLKRQL